MKKNILIVLLIMFIFVNCLYFCFFSNSREEVLVNYNGNGLMISIDGEESQVLPTTGFYYLANYSCDNDSTEIVWDNDSYELVISNGKEGGGVTCNLTFKSNPLLNEMPIGSYVAYEGKGGTVGTTSVKCQNDISLTSPSSDTVGAESRQSCLGQNARIDKDTSGYTYGYCYSVNYKYYTQGWRIAYIDDTTNKAAIISAGSPECNSRTSSTNNETYIRTANANALKYCNPEFVDGDSNGNKCTCTGIDNNNDGVYEQCSSMSSDVWAINDDTFNKMTEQATGVTGGGYLYNSINGATKCGGVYSTKVCGYNNNLIDNGGYYWFVSQYSSSSTYGVYWDPNNRHVYSNTSTNAYGLRPVISLSSSVFVTGGKGTMDSPYTISNNK